ncbi:MAG: hypothetical protein M1822_007800 [Bathelium mastoideum]|nr:MAG: hypothetical protein M1822_007800 [Bathelium mastoideum]
MTDEDPAKRLEAGPFCDMCGAFADSCYWKCDVCNDGAWGFCYSCVNQGRHCTHPLLSIAKDAPLPRPHDPGANPPTAAPRSAPFPGNGPSSPPSTSVPPTSDHITSSTAPSSTVLDPLPLIPPNYHPLTIPTTCDACRAPIPPSHARYHCPSCSPLGDYDLCQPCYHALVPAGRLAARDGPVGWRRCPRAGHRMLLVGFVADDSGTPRNQTQQQQQLRRRVVLRERVGGWALPDADVPPLLTTTGSGAAASSGWSRDEAPMAPVPDPAEEDAVGVAVGASVSWRRGRPGWSWRDADGTVRRSEGPQSPPLQAFETTSTGSSVAGAQQRGGEQQQGQGQGQKQKQKQGQRAGRGSEGQIPPDGGVGMRLRARWAWFPAEGVTNEVMFPRCAEIREAMDINGDWYWGVYAGKGGLFPGVYVVRA